MGVAWLVSNRVCSLPLFFPQSLFPCWSPSLEATVYGWGNGSEGCAANFRRVLLLFVSEPEIGVSVWDFKRELQCGGSLEPRFTIENH